MGAGLLFSPASYYARRSRTMIDLDLVPTDDLLKAVKRRYDATRGALKMGT